MSMIICTSLRYNAQQLLLPKDLLLFDFMFFLSKFNPLLREVDKSNLIQIAKGLNQICKYIVQDAPLMLLPGIEYCLYIYIVTDFFVGAKLFTMKQNRFITLEFVKLTKCFNTRKITIREGL